MTFALLFHDSEVGLVKSEAGTLVLQFSAAHVQRTAGHPGAGRETGHARTLELVFRQASWSGALPDCVGRLSQGRLSAGGVAHAALPLPFEAAGPVACELVFANGTLLEVSAASVQARFTGDPRFVESLAC